MEDPVVVRGPNPGERNTFLPRVTQFLRRMGQSLMAIPVIKRVVDHTVYLVRANRRRIAIGMPIVAILIAALSLIIWIFQLPSVSLSKESSIPSVQSIPLAPTELTEFKDTFGPWTVPVTIKRQTQTTNLLLLKEDGSVLVSGWGIKLSSRDWNTKGWPIELANMSKEGSSNTIVTNKGRRFTVHDDQPFVFEQTPLMVYSIRDDGSIWAISTGKAMNLRTEIR